MIAFESVTPSDVLIFFIAAISKDKQYKTTQMQK